MPEFAPRQTVDSQWVCLTASYCGSWVWIGERPIIRSIVDRSRRMPCSD